LGGREPPKRLGAQVLQLEVLKYHPASLALQLDLRSTLNQVTSLQDIRTIV
jgi:hypothetical protein